MEGYSKEDRRKHLILQCRYYNGESEPPKTLPKGYPLMWNYEKHWVEWSLNNDTKMQKMHEAEIHEFHLESRNGDKTPLVLKALLCNRYFHWCGGYSSFEVELENFEKWYSDFYQKWKTNRERRADKRRPGLIEKCKYYHGEDINPWCSNEVEGIAHQRKLYWDLEKQWVDELSMSFNSPLANHDLLKKLNLEDYFKSEGIALSLINHILEWHNQVEENSNSSFDHDKAINIYKEVYLEYSPNKK